MRTKKSNVNIFFQRLTKLYPYIPHVLLIASITAILFLLLMGMTSLLMSALMIFVPCIIGSIFLIFTRKSVVKHIPENVYILPFRQDRLRKIFGIAAALMLICLLLGQYNSLLYFILLIGLYLLIIFQLLTKNPNPRFVIFSLLYTTAVMILPLVLTPAYYYDGSDVIFHTNGIISILETGATASADLVNIYSIFCGMHIFAGVGVLLTSLAPHTSMFVLITFAYLGISVLVYLLSKQYCKSVTIGLLALYIFLSLPLVTDNLVTYAPFFVASLYFTVLLYLILRKQDGFKYRLFILAVLLVLASLSVHHAEHLPMLFISAFLLMANFFVQRTCGNTRDGKIINVSIILLYLSSVVLYLYYHYLNTTLHYILTAFRSDESNTLSSLSSSTNTLYVDYLHNWTYSSFVVICVFLALIGMYLLFTRSVQNPKKHLLALFIFIFFIVFIPGVVNSLPVFSSLHVYRWRGILAVVFAVVMALGLLALSSEIQHRIKWKYTGACISGLICILLLLSPCMAYAADNDVFKLSGLDIIHKTPNNAANEHFDDMDMAMFTTFTDRLPTEDTYTMENEGRRYMRTYVATDSSGLSITPLFTENLVDNTDSQTYNTVLFREKYFIERGFKYAAGSHYETIDANEDTLSTFANNLRQHHAIYRNGGGVVYHI